jgi:hypothetical protein
VATHRGARADTEQQGVVGVGELLAHLLLHQVQSLLDLVHQAGGQVAAWVWGKELQWHGVRAAGSRCAWAAIQVRMGSKGAIGAAPCGLRKCSPHVFDPSRSSPTR